MIVAKDTASGVGCTGAWEEHISPKRQQLLLGALITAMQNVEQVLSHHTIFQEKLKMNIFLWNIFFLNVGQSSHNCGPRWGHKHKLKTLAIESPVEKALYIKQCN